MRGRRTALLLFFSLMASDPIFAVVEPPKLEFSLKKNSAPSTIALGSKSLDRPIVRAGQDTQQAGTNPVVTQIRAEITQLKKKRKTSLIASIACAVAGGAFMYGFATYGEQLEPGRDPSQDQIKDPMFSRKRLYILGAATAFAVSLTLYFDVAGKSRAIKSREAELKRLAEAGESAPAGLHRPHKTH